MERNAVRYAKSEWRVLAQADSPFIVRLHIESKSLAHKRVQLRLSLPHTLTQELTAPVLEIMQQRGSCSCDVHASGGKMLPAMRHDNLLLERHNDLVDLGIICRC